MEMFHVVGNFDTGGNFVLTPNYVIAETDTGDLFDFHATK